jgi:DNA-binding MarR family transcriptional regulator
MDKLTREIVEGMKAFGMLLKKRRKTSGFPVHGMQNLTLAQLEVLGYIYEHKNAKMSDLAKHANVKMPTMTDMINKLVKMGLLKREHDENDRRTVWIHITKELEKNVCGHIKLHDEEIAKYLGVLTVQEKENTVKILGKLKKSLERIR